MVDMILYTAGSKFCFGFAFFALLNIQFTSEYLIRDYGCETTKYGEKRGMCHRELAVLNNVC